MAILAACTDGGDFTASGTWDVVDFTSFASSTAGSTAPGVAYDDTSAFTPGAINVDGIALRIATRVAAPTGTLSAALAQGGATVAGTEVTINTSDLLAATTDDNGWLFFKFAAPVSLAAATAYTVRAKQSVASEMTLYRDATAKNWSRALRTTDKAAPAVGDSMIVTGEWTGAGAKSNIGITMNNTAATAFGSLSVCNGGTVTYGSTAATAYKLRLGGNLTVYGGGKLDIGGTTPIPSDSSAILEFVCVSAGDFGLIINNLATLTMGGQAVTTMKTYMTADKSIGNTTLQVGSTAGWNNNDTIMIGTTTTVGTQCEMRVITTVDSPTQVTIPALTYAHSGSNGGPAGESTAALVIHLTRNVKIFGQVAAASYVFCNANSTVVMNNVEIYYCGTNAAATKYGLVFNNIAGSCSASGLAIHDMNFSGLVITGYGTISSMTLSDINIANTGIVTAGFGVYINSPTMTGLSMSNIVLMSFKQNTNQGGFVIYGTGTATLFDNIYVIGSTGTQNSGLYINGGTSSYSNLYLSGNSTGLQITGTITITINNANIWRNSANGIVQSTNYQPTLLNNMSIFGNTTYGIYIQSNSTVIGKNLIFNSETSYAQANAMGIYYGFHFFTDCSFGVSKVHSGGDISPVGNSACTEVQFFNCVFGSSTEVAVNTAMHPMSSFKSTKHDGGTGSRCWYLGGTIDSETTTRHTNSGFSWRMAGSNNNPTTNKLRLPGPSIFDTFKAAVIAYKQTTVSVYLMKNVNYNGVAPKLVVVGGIINGIATDQIATMTVANLLWEKLSVTVTPLETGCIEFYIEVDMDNTAKYVYVDDITVIQQP